MNPQPAHVQCRGPRVGARVRRRSRPGSDSDTRTSRTHTRPAHRGQAIVVIRLALAGLAPPCKSHSVGWWPAPRRSVALPIAVASAMCARRLLPGYSSPKARRATTASSTRHGYARCSAGSASSAVHPTTGSGTAAARAARPPASVRHQAPRRGDATRPLARSRASPDTGSCQELAVEPVTRHGQGLRMAARTRSTGCASGPGPCAKPPRPARTRGRPRTGPGLGLREPGPCSLEGGRVAGRPPRRGPLTPS